MRYGACLLLILAAGIPAAAQPLTAGQATDQCAGNLRLCLRGRGSTAGSGQIFQEPLATFTGTVQEISVKSLTLRDADSNTLQFACTHKTRYFDGAKKIKASDIKPGDRVSIETKRFPDGELEAINVRLERKKPS